MENEIDVLTLAERLKTAPDEAVFDVRSRAELLASPRRIPGAQWRDPDQVQRWAAEFAQGQPVVVYDLTGGPVSRAVASLLWEKGIDARYLAGGLVAWMTWVSLEAHRT
jgi:Fe-Mn family superoxide dismutase